MFGKWKIHPHPISMISPSYPVYSIVPVHVWQKLVGGLEHVLLFISYMDIWYVIRNPLTRLIFHEHIAPTRKPDLRVFHVEPRRPGGPGDLGGTLNHDTSFSRARVNHKLREIIPSYGRTIFGWVTYDNFINLPRNMNVTNSLSMEMVVDHFYVQFLYG